MKKEGKNSVTSGRTIAENGKLGRHNQRPTAGDKAMFERSPKDRIRSHYDITSPNNKENQPKTANREADGLSSPQCPLSPLQCLSPKGTLSPSNFVSPSRTTPLESLDALRSNKGKEELNPSANSSILFSGFSKDGRHKVESHYLEGEELVRACEYERKVNFSTRLQSKKRGNTEGIPAIDPARTSIKENGVFKSYAVNTHSGISRNYNEDRVSITLNIKKKGVRAQFFAIYDGHGGSLCCDYLKDNLH